jgi:group I intron endonuclease
MTKAKRIVATYRIRNVVSGSFYIGSSTNLYERWRTHRKKLRSNTHPNPQLQASWNKHSEDAFRFEVLQVHESRDEMENAEEALLQRHIADPQCCNLSAWSRTPWREKGERHPRYGIPLPEDRKQRLREATLEQWKVSDPRTGRKHSEETRAKIREKMRQAVAEGRGGCFVPSEETRAKMSAALKGNQNAKGHERSEEHRRKLSESAKGNQHWLGRSHSEEAKAKMGRAVRMISPDGEVTTHPRLTAVTEQFGLFLPTIHRSVRSGKPLAKGPYKGWRFEYA